MDQNLDVDVNIRLYIVSLTIVLVPIGCIRNLRYLVPLSMVALVFLMFSCGVVLYDSLLDLPPLSSRPFFSSWSHLPLFYATMCFAIEGIGTVSFNLYLNHRVGTFATLSLEVVWIKHSRNALQHNNYHVNQYSTWTIESVPPLWYVPTYQQAKSNGLL